MELTLKQKVILLYRWFLKDQLFQFFQMSLVVILLMLTFSPQIVLFSLGLTVWVVSGGYCLKEFVEQSKQKIDEFPERLERVKFAMKRIPELLLEMKELHEEFNKDKEKENV